MRTMAVAAAAGLLAAAPALGQPAAPAPQPAAPAPQPAAPAPQPPTVAPPAAAAAGPVNVDQLVRLNLQQERQALLAGRTQAERDEAARRLVNLRSDEARGYLLAALQAADNPRAQLAAATAAADDPAPDPRWADPLDKMLGGESLTEAATAALLNLAGRGSGARTPAADDAFERVRRFVSGPNTVRPITIRALGKSVDQRVANLLVDLTRDRNPTNRNYAADALAEMTGLADNGRDPAAWAAWWQQAQRKTPDQFRAELLDRRARRPAATPGTERLLGNLYGLAADKDKPAALRAMLDAPDPPFRAAGVRLLYSIFSTTGKLPESVPRVRELIRDSSPDVRLEAARALGNLNDKPSLEPLLAQLRVEAEPAVRLALMQALVRMQDARAASELVRLLNDPSVATATLAAETLAKIGGETRKDKKLAADVGRALVDTINRRAARDPAGDLQGACVEALVSLQDPQHRDLFLTLASNAGLPVRVRKAALAGVGEVGTRDDADEVFNRVLRNDREDVGVRIAALGAMERLRNFAYADELFKRSAQQGRDDEGVWRAARRAFEALLPQADDRQLVAWADQLGRANDYAAQVPVLAERVRRLAAAGPTQADELARVRESFGEAYVKSGQPQSAIEPFRRAFQYWQDQKAAERAYVGVRDRLLGAYLQAGLYAQAVQYAQQVVAGGYAQQDEMLSIILREVERLNDPPRSQPPQAPQPAKAVQLATEAMKFPGLTDPYRSLLAAQLRKARDPLSAPPGQPPGPGRL